LARAEKWHLEVVVAIYQRQEALRRFPSVRDQVANPFMLCRYNANAQGKHDRQSKCWIVFPHNFGILVLAILPARLSIT
jgi:hypothetical protein